jgi:hypothetical protein
VRRPRERGLLGEVLAVGGLLRGGGPEAAPRLARLVEQVDALRGADQEP